MAPHRISLEEIRERLLETGEDLAEVIDTLEHLAAELEPHTATPPEEEEEE